MNVLFSKCMIGSAWEQFTSAELEQKLMVLREVIESCMLTDRSAEHQLTEIGIIESELAKRHVVATGPDGAITTEDVEKTARIAAATTPAEEVRGVRRAMAVNMARAAAEIVPATVSDDANIGDWREGEDFTTRLVRAVVAGCKVAPALNAWYDGARMERRLHGTIDLGLAVDIGDGLIVPVLRDVGNRDAASLRQGVDRLKADVRARTVPLVELRGQTMTLSNFGMFAGRYATLVIVPPQVAILGAGMARLVVVPRDGKPVVRRVLPLSLTFDHRAVTGGEAALFLRAAIRDLEQQT